MGKNKDRLNQKSIPWAEDILSQVMNLPPAGGEDLQSTAEAQNTAVEALIRMVSRKVADHKGEGEYVWKKYALETVELTKPTIYIKGAAGTGAAVTCEVADLALVDESFFDGFTYNGRYFFYDESGLHYYNGSSNYDAVWDGDARTITLINNTASFSGTTFTYTGTKTVYQKADGDSYVVANGEDSYPTNGEFDGSCFVRFDPSTAIAENIRKGVSIFDIVGTMVGGLDLSAMGLTKCAVDKFTFSENTSINGYQLSHSLKTTPKVVLILGEGMNNTVMSTGYVFSAIGFNSGYGSMYGAYQYMGTTPATKLCDTLSPVTTSKVAFNGNIGKFQAGIEYTMITMA